MTTPSAGTASVAEAERLREYASHVVVLADGLTKLGVECSGLSLLSKVINEAADQLTAANSRIVKLEGEQGTVNDALGIVDHCQIVPLFDILQNRIRVLTEALQQAADLIAIPAKHHARELEDKAHNITNGPRYSEGARVHNMECCNLLPSLKAALAEGAGGGT